MKLSGITLLLLLSAWVINFYADADFFSTYGHQASQEMTALEKAGGECVAISEQATAHLVPKLEFQRLELAGRKANVVVHCMADRGFYQNPAWLKYAEPIAASVASAQNISTDEALESLKRKDMLVLVPQSNQPAYWQQARKPAVQ